MLNGFTRTATRYYPYRWRFVAASGLVFICLILVFFTFPRAVAIITPFVGPALAVSWGMVLVCFWFEPVQGSLFSGGFVKFIPRIGQIALRWYAAVFLVIWFVFGIVVWPLFVLLM
jgi:hypothetical protein